jgi:hypothetical protein
MFWEQYGLGRSWWCIAINKNRSKNCREVQWRSARQLKWLLLKWIHRLTWSCPGTSGDWDVGIRTSDFVIRQSWFFDLCSWTFGYNLNLEFQFSHLKQTNHRHPAELFNYLLNKHLLNIEYPANICLTGWSHWMVVTNIGMASAVFKPTVMTQ